jgi:hypothetical protein
LLYLSSSSAASSSSSSSSPPSGCSRKVPSKDRGDIFLRASLPGWPQGGDCSDSEWLNSDSESEFMVRLSSIVRFVCGLVRSAGLSGFCWPFSNLPLATAAVARGSPASSSVEVSVAVLSDLQRQHSGRGQPRCTTEAANSVSEPIAHKQ